MSLSAYREQLIARVDPANKGFSQGREAYRKSMEAIGENIAGSSATVRDLSIRILKGTNRLHLPSSRITLDGMATADGELVDCRAAIVRKEHGAVGGTEYDYRRHSGKESAHTTRIQPSYDSSLKRFSLSAPDAQSSPTKEFDTSVLYPRDGQLVQARFGDNVLEGVLDHGALTEHVRECLADFEKRVPPEDLFVLLPHLWFRRSSDTRQRPNGRIRTLFTDGAQAHGMNENSPHGPQCMDAFRPGVTLGGDNFPPNIEDLVHKAHIVTSAGDKPVHFQSLTPRCLVTQRHLVTGAITSQQKHWLRTNRPLRPWDSSATMGANMDFPPSGEDALISVGDTLVVESEKDDWKM